jgi:hypothetical protein
MNTHDTTTVPQWAKDAANDFYDPDHHPWATRMRLAAIIASHAPAQMPKASIWRPWSVMPTEEDGDQIGEILSARAGGIVLIMWDAFGKHTESHWTRTADLLALAPLPAAKTQDELDAEAYRAIKQKLVVEYAAGSQFKGTELAFIAGCKHGRSTATAAKETK